jgi:hypothetical protein
MQNINTMTSVVSAVDQYTPKQLGENGNVEHGWSNALYDRIVQFFFQLVRSEDHSDLEKNLRDILSTFRGQESKYIVQMCLMYKLIGQTRDIIGGKGEQQLSFMQLWVWYEFYPALALQAFDHFVLLNGDESIHPYGSWKDVKYWCEFIRKKSGNHQHPLIEKALDISIRQLLYDETRYDCYYETDSETNTMVKPQISLCAKWLPREKSKYGWIFRQMAEKMFGYFQDTAKSEKSRRKAKLKGRIILKKLLVKLNRYLDTAQIKMCGRTWTDLNFNHLTSQTLRRNKLAIMNTTKKSERRSTNSDRIQCASNYKNHISAAKVDPKRHKMHGKRCAVYELVKDALDANTLSHVSLRQVACDTVNLQWEDNRTNNKGLEKTPIIAMVDTSSSMTSDNSIPLFNAIGLGIRTSELTHPAFKHRCLTFNAEPHWINLDSCADFVSKVLKIKSSPWGMNTNFYKALQLILNCILENNIPPSQVSGMVLAVFSDMQIDNRWSGDNKTSLKTMFEEIRQMYAEAGLQSKFHMPYEPPHILFWNLRKTNGFPTLSTEKNVTLLSGYSSTLLNIFCNKGIIALREFTPQKLLEDLLSNPRYITLEETIIARFA